MADILGEKDICKKCGKCCRLIYSLKPYEELYEESKNGDSTALNFLKLFVPYVSQKDALEIDAEAVKSICEYNEKAYGAGSVTYFYYCRYIGEDNLCTVYDRRPKFCRQYPKNEFIILPQDCSYEGYSFMAREKVKAKVRKAKEELIDIKLMRMKSEDRGTIERLNKMENKCVQYIEKYKPFGSEDW